MPKDKKKKPNHYQAVCPACRAVNKVSVKEMQPELDAASDEIQSMVSEYEDSKAKARAEKQKKTKSRAAVEAKRNQKKQ